MSAEKSWFERVDDAIYTAEKLIVGAFFIAMTAMVFGAVVLRVFSAPESRIAGLWGAVGLDPHAQLVRQGLVPLTLALLTVVILYGALRERWGPQSSRKKAMLSAILGSATLGFCVQGFVKLFPSGMPWSQPLALAMMLWVGVIGASMAAKQRRHLALELGSKIWPARLQKPVRILAALAVAVFCAFLTLLAFRLVVAEYADYNPIDQTGVFPGFGLPKFAVFAILPYGFVMIILRYFRGSLDAREVNELDHLLKPSGAEPQS